MSSSSEFTVPDMGHGLESQELFATVYSDLRRIAARELRRNRAIASPTTLVHETFLSLSRRKFVDESHFLAYAALAMRGVIITQLRSRGRQKRGGDHEFVALPTEFPIAGERDLSIEALAEALEELTKRDARLAQCVDLKFFCGFSLTEIARMWNVSERTVQRDWDKARVLLNRLIQDAQQSPSAPV